MEAFRYSYEKEGFLGIFQNGKLTSQIIRDIPYAIIIAIVYDLLQVFINYLRYHRESGVTERLSSREMFEAGVKHKVAKYHQLQDAFCGAVAGGLSSYLTTPLDVIKTRLMTGSSDYSSVGDALRRIYSEEGFSTFFNGAVSRVAHKIPANALFFLFLEAIRYMLGTVEVRSEQ
jgi:hypothetical protein